MIESERVSCTGNVDVRERFWWSISVPSLPVVRREVERISSVLLRPTPTPDQSPDMGRPSGYSWGKDGGVSTSVSVSCVVSEAAREAYLDCYEVLQLSKAP